jgi:hypothetical protein
MAGADTSLWAPLATGLLTGLFALGGIGVGGWWVHLGWSGGNIDDE